MNLAAPNRLDCETRFQPRNLGPAGVVHLDLAGAVVEIASDSANWLAGVHERYGAFVGAEATHDIVIRHTVDEQAMMASEGWLSRVDPDGRGADVASKKGTDILDGVLRTLLPAVIAPDLMAHGTLFDIGNGRGVLCCGVSGTGKSTIAALFPEAALCDELVRLEATGTGVVARSLPYWRARPGSVELAAVCVLSHGEVNSRTAVEGTRAIQEIRRHVYWPVGNSDDLSSSFGTVVHICRVLPVFRLAFVPTTAVWATMTEGL